MGLTLVTGRSNAGKTGCLYDSVRSEAHAGRGPVVLLPTAPDADRAMREFSAGGVGGVRAVVLDRWVAEQWALWGDGRSLVVGGQREALIARAVELTDLDTLAASAAHQGFVDSLAGLVRHAPDPETIQPSTPHDDEVRSIIVAYNLQLAEEGLIELAEAAELLAADPPPTLPPLYFNRFTDLAPSQERMLVGFSRATQVWVALPWEEGHAGTEALTPLVRRLEVKGEHLALPQPDPDDELGELERKLYAPGGRLQPTGMLFLGEAPDQSREVTLAIDAIVHFLDEGVDPSRIVLAFRSAERRAPLVIAAAREAGVPLYVDLKRPLSRTALGKSLSALIDAASGSDASRERFAAFTRSVHSGMCPEQAALLDRTWRRSRAKGEALLTSVVRLGGAAGATVEAAIGVAKSHGDATAQKWKDLADLLVHNAWTSQGYDYSHGAEDAAAHAAITRTIAAILGFSRHAPVSEVRAALARMNIAYSTGDEQAAVHFTEAQRVRAMRYDVVVLGGLDSREFSAHREPSWESAYLERVGAGSEEAERSQERLLFYSLVTRARKGLVMLRSTGEGEGKELAPSEFWEEVVDLYRDPSDESEGIPTPLILLPEAPRGPIATACAHTPGRRSERVAAVPPYRPSRGSVLGGRAAELLGEAEEFSVTEIETYLSCPYRWFFQRALRPQEIDREVGAKEWGSAAHEILSRFYTEWRARDSVRITRQTLETARALLEEVCDAVLGQYADAYSVEEECGASLVRDRVHQLIEDDVAYLPGFIPCGVEMTFGSSGERPFEFGGVRLRGSIDRVDCSDSALIVTDYKSGASLKGHGSFASEGYVQLPVYAAAASEILGKRAVGAVYRSLAKRRSIRGFWMAEEVDVCGWGTRTDPVDTSSFEGILAEAAERVAEAAQGIRSGSIAPRPIDGACRLCAAKPVCRTGATR